MSENKLENTCIDFWPRYLRMRYWMCRYKYVGYWMLCFGVGILCISCGKVIHSYVSHQEAKDMLQGLEQSEEREFLGQKMQAYEKASRAIGEKTKAFLMYRWQRRALYHIWDQVNSLRTVKAMNVYVDSIQFTEDTFVVKGGAEDTQTGNILARHLQGALQGVDVHEQQSAKTDGKGFSFTIQGHCQSQSLTPPMDSTGN